MVEGRKMYDLVAVPEQGAGGGLLLFKGTESLVGAAATATTTPTDAGGGEDGQEGNTQAEPWSALGLSRTETSRLLFRTCAGGEGLRAPTTFAVLGNRPLPCGEWVHVACDISKVGGNFVIRECSFDLLVESPAFADEHQTTRHNTHNP